MKPNASLWERFEGWFCVPIEKLRDCPDGDGAFLAMSAALFLCERFYRTQTNTHEGHGGDLAFRQAAAKDLGLDPATFEIFWQVYRHGIQHQGMPKQFIDNKTGVTYIWNISSGYSAVPTFANIDSKTKVIQIDPWKFAEIMKAKYKQNPEILKNAVTHAFGEVQ